MRRRFMRRVFLGALAVFLLLVATGIVLGALLGDHGWNGGPEHRGGFLPFGLLFLGAMVLVFVLVARRIRRTAGSVGMVMEAVGKVAEGDLGARVEPRGAGDERDLAHAFNRMATRLESDERRRRELLADLAHELRTPLSVIRGNVEAMLDGLYPADHEHLRTVLDETDVLARLLDDLRTLSTAEAGVLVLHRESVETTRLVGDAVAAFGAQADERRVTLGSSVDDVVGTLFVDPVRIGEVLTNVLQNSLRHTPPGGTVDVTARPTSLGGEPAIELVVADSGRGIDAELLPHVFDRFVRSADSGGSGLGLAIAKSLVEAHGGTIEAELCDAGGTVVRIVLPSSGAEPSGQSP